MKRTSDLKQLRLLAAVLACAFLVSACAVGAGSPVTGVAINTGTGPMDATSNIVGPKTGEASATSILGLFGFGDASIKKAAENGGIRKISTVDQKSMNILGIFATSTTIVTGE